MNDTQNETPQGLDSEANIEITPERKLREIPLTDNDDFDATRAKVKKSGKGEVLSTDLVDDSEMIKPPSLDDPLAA